MAVERLNDAPVANADSFGRGQQGGRLQVGTTHPDTHEVELAGDVLDGDTDVDTPAANLTVTPGTFATADGAVVIPQAGPRVWFVDDTAPAGGRGVSRGPLQSLQSLQLLAPLSTGGAHDSKDGTGDRIFVQQCTYGFPWTVCSRDSCNAVVQSPPSAPARA